jgi:hypothetical protein
VPSADEGAAGAFVVFVAVAAYLLLFRSYGFDPLDEGTLLAQIDRVRRGEVPYRDFHTGYTPGLFYLNAWLFEIFGVQVQVVRSALAVLHAAEMSALYWLARRLTGAAAAGGLVALCVVAFRPIATGAFALFNVPYAGWYAQAVATLALVVTLTAASRDRGWIAAGAVWGLVFCFKQNTGLFGLGAAACFVALDDRPERRATIVWGAALAAALLAGGAAVVRAAGTTPWGAAAVGSALVPLAVAIVRARPGAPFARRAARLLAGFAVVAIPMLLGAVLLAGVTPVSRSIFHVGSGAAAVYGQAYPSLAELADSLGAGLGSLRAGRQAFEALWFVVFPAGVTLAACTLAWRSTTASPAWRLAVSAGVLFHLQMLPRSDFWHLAHVAGPLLLVTVGLVLRAGRWTRATPGLVVVGLWVRVVVRAVPTGAVVLDCLRPPPPASQPPLARADLRWDLVTDETIGVVPDVVRALQGARTVVGFPALSGLGFLAAAASPLPHDYFLPGLLDDRERRAMVALLTSAPPDAVVILRDERAFASAATRDYPTILQALETVCPAAERIGSFEVRLRGTP